MNYAGIIAGIIVGLVAVIAFAVLVICCCSRCHRKSQQKKFALEARVLGIRNAVPLDHLNEAQQRAVVVAQLNRTLPLDVSLAEAVFTAQRARNAFLVDTVPIEDGARAEALLSGSATDVAGAGARLNGAALMRQPHILELEMLLPEPYQVPVLDALPSRSATTATTTVAVTGTDMGMTTSVAVADNTQSYGAEVAEASRVVDSSSLQPSQPPSRHTSSLARFIPFFGGGRNGEGTEDTNGTATATTGSPPPPQPQLSNDLPYSPTLAEPQQRLWDLYLKKKAIQGEVVEETSPPETPTYYGAHRTTYEARPDQPPVLVHALSHTQTLTEPVTPAEASLQGSSSATI